LNNFLTKRVEHYLFFPNLLEQLISIFLLPLTLLYCMITTYKRLSAKILDFHIPIISIGNLVVGGTGKTPLTIALAKDKKNVSIVLRGYGRESKGLFVVSKNGKILEDVKTSGDEAQLLANALPNASVIVSEDRVKGIIKAKELGAKVVFLDDGYSQHHIKKFNILVRPKDEPTNVFCLPSGGYRDTKMVYAFVDLVLRDGEDFTRVVKFTKNNQTVEQLPKKIVLVTAISKPNRLLEYLPKGIKMVRFPDHYNYKKNDIEDIIKQYPDYALVTTEKDMVKLNKFNLKNIYLMKLNITINNTTKIDQYINTV